MGGFGAGNPPNSNARTNRDSSTIYLRRNFQPGNFSKEAIDYLKLQVYYDEGCTVYINGVRAAPYRICPNPASDYFQLVGNTGCNTELIDSGGKIVRRYPKETRNCDINNYDAFEQAIFQEAVYGLLFNFM